MYGLPSLGVGLTWHYRQHANIKDNLKRIDWVEVITEQFVNTNNDRLALLADLATLTPVCTHGVSMSIGTPGPLKQQLLQETVRLGDMINSPWFSEHLCFTEVPGIDLGQLTPVPFTDEQVDVVVSHVAQLRAHTSRPFLLENITYYFEAPGSTMSEAQFLKVTAEKADIGLLLDVTNVYINAMNHHYDPVEFVMKLPLERVVELHVAGGEHHGELVVDTHSQPVPPEVWQLTEHVCRHAPVKAIMLERDANQPSFEELLDELSIARAIFQRHRT